MRNSVHYFFLPFGPRAGEAHMRHAALGELLRHTRPGCLSRAWPRLSSAGAGACCARAAHSHRAAGSCEPRAADCGGGPCGDAECRLRPASPSAHSSRLDPSSTPVSSTRRLELYAIPESTSRFSPGDQPGGAPHHCHHGWILPFCGWGTSISTRIRSRCCAAYVTRRESSSRACTCIAASARRRCCAKLRNA